MRQVCPEVCSPPLLALGAQFGLLSGVACRLLFPNLAIEPEAFVLVGMAALFAGVVRSPMTGIVLVAEMTGNATLLLPMLGACFMATLLPMLLHEAPIYDSLRERTLRLEQSIRQKKIAHWMTRWRLGRRRANDRCGSSFSPGPDLPKNPLCGGTVQLRLGLAASCALLVWTGGISSRLADVRCKACYRVP